MKHSALRSGLNAKVKDGEVVLVDALQIDKPKTKEMAALLGALKIEGKALLVVDKMTDSLKLSCRNIPGISLKTGHEVNVYDLLRHPKVVIEQAAFAGLCESFKEEPAS